MFQNSELEAARKAKKKLQDEISKNMDDIRIYVHIMETELIGIRKLYRNLEKENLLDEKV